jgi:methylphosphotriester-DNA--protein-cysteine methyltransferase
MLDHKNIKSLFTSIRSGMIQFAGNRRLKIYGRLDCWSGKRMKKENRVFFRNEKEAIELGYRPCGHCMKKR